MTESQASRSTPLTTVQDNTPSLEYGVVASTQTAASLAKSWALPLTDLWVPCAAAATSRGFIEVDETTPIAYAVGGNISSPSDAASLLLDRVKILEHLKLVPPNPRQFSVPEGLLARSNGVLYVRLAQGGGRMRVSEGTCVMKRRISQEIAIREGSAFPPSLATSSSSSLPAASTKRTAAAVRSPAPSVVSTSVASGVPKQQWQERMEALVAERFDNEATKQSNKKKRERSDNDEHDPSTTVQSSGEAFLQNLHDSIRKVRAETPLHLVKLLGGNFKEIVLRVGSSFQVGPRVWLRPDLSIISYQHLPEANRKVTGAAGRIFAPQRLIAVLPLLHCLMQPKEVEDDLLEHEPTLVDNGGSETIELLKRLSLRGYKIVFVEHFPMLHHGNAYALQMITNRIATFLETHLPSIAVQVVLSVASFYSSAVPGVSRCILPNAGVYQAFLYHYNGQIEADGDRSFFVRTAVENIGGYGFSSCSFEDQSGFASCCGKKGLRAIPFTSLGEVTDLLCA
ncbi:Hypothetical protein, putative [Bodo saltans]|uniref:Uncharacterized protein n=1 Tax=Bodo saltans TaxID=75058 RepID=A0A0S4JEW0_BODSA|nr:Hypothetical protein, putative [Bodo saltans]|eukprot:CUG88513.1 Hypothetical protein, putative [Bodo saltans]